MSDERGAMGASVVGKGTRFRVWAPEHERVDVVIEANGLRRVVALTSEGDGLFATVAANVHAGARYGFRLDDDPALHADPCSKFQPDGPLGLSCVVDPAAFRWKHWGWRGRGLRGQVFYELHIGTFTREGTWAAAQAKLPALADLGVTTLEVMPIADFAGDFGWGYDGVCLFAPTRLYGTPDDLCRFIDEAHGLGIGVILDVVYNHIGPAGSVLTRFSPYYASANATDWGAGLNFDGPHSGPVRAFVVENAAYWVRDYHFDGLRLDATQNIVDSSPEHIIAAIARAVRRAAPQRETLVIGENESQEVRLLRPNEENGYGLDALWNDDFHHTTRVALTGFREAYYKDYGGTPQELLSALKWGYLFQGQRYAWQKKRRGTPALDLTPGQLVLFLENHDQVANSALGHRLHRMASPKSLRAMVAVLLLAPGTPLLFQGEEFRSRAPFLFFADHDDTLAEAVERGRRDFLGQFPSLAADEVKAKIAAPGRRSTFETCKLDWSERATNASWLCLYKDLLTLRRTDPVFARQEPRGIDGAVIGAGAFATRFFGGSDGDRLLLVNLGVALDLESIAEPLLAPPDGRTWVLAWSSEDLRYDGDGTPPIYDDGAFRLPGEAAVVLRPSEGGVP